MTKMTKKLILPDGTRLLTKAICGYGSYEGTDGVRLRIIWQDGGDTYHECDDIDEAVKQLDDIFSVQA